MSYPQPISSVSVLKSQEYFRLFTSIQSNGDIYEIDTSLKGLVIGPQSDIQSVRGYYFDDQAPGNIEEIVASVSDPFLGRIDARMNEEYPQMATKGRILVTSDDVVPHDDQTFVRASPTHDAVNDLVVWHRPQIDLLAYHSSQGAVPMARAEKQWNHTVSINDQGAGAGVSWYFFPFYRRKYFHARFIPYQAIVSAPTYYLFGVTLYPSVDSAPWVGFHQIATGTISGTQYNTTDVVMYADRDDVITAAMAHGYFDYMCVAVAWDDVVVAASPLVFDAIATDWV